MRKKEDGLPGLMDRLRTTIAKIAAAEGIEKEKRESAQLKKLLGWAFVAQKEAVSFFSGSSVAVQIFAS